MKTANSNQMAVRVSGERRRRTGVAFAASKLMSSGVVITLNRSASRTSSAGSSGLGESPPLERRPTFRSPMRPPSATSPRVSTVVWLGVAHEVAAPPPSEGYALPARSLECSLEVPKRFRTRIQGASHRTSSRAPGGEVDR